MIVSLIQRLGKNKVYIGLTAIVFFLTLLQWTMRLIIYEKEQHALVHDELFNEDLESLNSVESLSLYIDSLSDLKGIGPEQHELYVMMIDSIIRERFYHGKSNILYCDNFIAWIFGKFVWSHFYVGVTPDEILSHPNALCSQSAIVFQEIVMKKGFKVRAVGLNRHFCSEVFYEGSWHFMDSDKEPVFDKEKPIPSVEELSKNEDLINQIYVRDSENVSLEQMTEMFTGNEILFYRENEFPAKKMYIFQIVSKFLSDFLSIILAIPIFLAYSGIVKNWKV